MCGRFAQVVKHNQLKRLLDELAIKNKDEQIEINYNVAPTQPVGALIYKGPDRFLTFFRWGLIPSWSKEPSTQFSMINVRSETILEKPTFKNALLKRRCLIPATGFYEWRKADKQPFFIHRKGSEQAADSSSTFAELLFLAGITEYWTGADGSYIQSCAIITTAANSVMQPIHDRMPVILTQDVVESWLREDFKDPASLQSFLQPCQAELIDLYPVSKKVSSVANNSEDLLKPMLAL
jgi:putative SOS response-associated peptidase YedK